jgi:transcriptional regulator with GAF, ATPase, and Fis domain
MKAWLQSFVEPSDWVTSVLAALRSTLEIEPYSLRMSTDRGIVLIESASAEVRAFLREASRDGLERVIAIACTTRDTSTRESWDVLRAGASDVIPWREVSDAPAFILARFERWAAIDSLVESSRVREELVGRSAAWIGTLRRIVEAARFTDTTILVTGESGTGKELVARLVHALDPRREKRDFVVVDCTTVVPELSGSEFFGHERGAFTGAYAARDGAFSLANGGTLFLDEVGELPSALQAELLRVVQEHTFKRVGSNTWQRTTFRLVCATNRNLLDDRTHFRRDLYYRIAGWCCELPPLRERREDIPLLAGHFLRQFRGGADPPDLDETVRDHLVKREYPGNVRELQQLMARVLIRHVGRGPVTSGDVPSEDWPDSNAAPDWRDDAFDAAIRRAVALKVPMKQIGHAAEETAIRMALRSHEGSLQRAATALGVSRRTLELRRAARLNDLRSSEEVA